MHAAQSQDLHDRYQSLLQQEAHLRARDAAAKLGVSEAELVEALPGAVRLRPEWAEIIADIPTLGEVLALTRNESAVHEKRGAYPAPSGHGGSVLVHSKNIDLRIFLAGWAVGFAVRDTNRKGEERRSLQFFDAAGDATHKVWLEEKSNVEAFEKMVEKFSAGASEEHFVPQPIVDPEDPADADVDVEGLRAAWGELKDTHQFFWMLKKFKVGRLQALRLADGSFTRKVPTELLRSVFTTASQDVTPIMVFVGSRGVIQIHSGPIERFSPKNEWLNIFDPEFGLHLREDHVAQAFVVRKPTIDGDVTSLEVFDKDGREIALVFGDRKPGLPEAESWRDCLQKAEEALRA